MIEQFLDYIQDYTKPYINDIVGLLSQEIAGCSSEVQFVYKNICISTLINLVFRAEPEVRQKYGEKTLQMLMQTLMEGKMNQRDLIQNWMLVYNHGQEFIAPVMNQFVQSIFGLIEQKKMQHFLKRSDGNSKLMNWLRFYYQLIKNMILIMREKVKQFFPQFLEYFQQIISQDIEREMKQEILSTCVNMVGISQS